MKRFVLVLLVLVLSASGCLAEESTQNYDEFGSLYALAENYGFRLGACFSYDQLQDESYLNVMARHFNSITCTNETKAYSLLDQKASRRSKDGMPRMDFSNADRMISWAQKNGVGVRGHVLVWDAYMTGWFFHEGYADNKPIASQEVMRERLKSYIEQVITHFEEEFPGVIYCWDVVNEAIGDNPGEYDAGDPRHIRTVRSGQRNPFLDYVGDDYVEYAFLCASDTVKALGADIKLFYNDYNMFMNSKITPACKLIDSINHYALDENGEYRTLIDGIGMQGYIGGYGVQEGCLVDSHLDMIKNEILSYAAMGLEVQITEMAVRNFDLAQADKHAQFYANLFKVFMSLKGENGNPLKAVSIWGLTDTNAPKGNYVYNLNSPYGGLFDLKLNEKDAFAKVYEALKQQ